MVAFPAHWVAAPTENSALIAVNGSRSGHVLFHDVEAHHRRARFRAFRDLTYTEEDLPRQEVWEQRRRRREERVLREKRTDVGAEWTDGEVFRSGEGW